MEPKISPEERARYLVLIQRRAAKLAEVAGNEQMEAYMPGAKDFLLARYIFMLVLAALPLMAAELRAHFMGWFLEQIREGNGLCPIDGKPKLMVTDLACQDCLAQFAAIDQELGLDDISPLDARD